MKKIINFKQKKEERFAYLLMELLADDNLMSESKIDYIERLEKDYNNFIKFYNNSTYVRKTTKNQTN